MFGAAVLASGRTAVWTASCVLEGSGTLLKASWALLGVSWALLGRSWACLGRSWGALRGILGAPSGQNAGRREPETLQNQLPEASRTQNTNSSNALFSNLMLFPKRLGRKGFLCCIRRVAVGRTGGIRGTPCSRGSTPLEPPGGRFPRALSENYVAVLPPGRGNPVDPPYS